MITILIPAGAAGTSIPIDEDELHHLRVRRVELPADVRFVDGAGRTGTGRLTRDGRVAVLQVRESHVVPRPALRMLAVGAGDKDRFGWMVEKATELGVTDIVPLAVTNARGVAGGVGATQLDRLTKRAREALKQCGGLWAPIVHPPSSIPEFLSAMTAMTAMTAMSAPSRWLLDPEGTRPGAISQDTGIVAAIGPEGGFTSDERRQLLEYGFAPVAVGRQILRFETAAIAAAVLMQQDQDHTGD